MIRLNKTIPILGFRVHCCWTGAGGLNDALTFGPADARGWADSLRPLARDDNAETLVLRLIGARNNQLGVGGGIIERPDSSAPTCFRFWARDFGGESNSSRSSSLSESLNYERYKFTTHIPWLMWPETYHIFINKHKPQINLSVLKVSRRTKLHINEML